MRTRAATGVLSRLLALVAAAMLGFAAIAAPLPALTGRVVDAADLIGPAAEARIVARLAEFERKSSDQIVVATIPSLDGEAIEAYANRLFRAWGLGQAGENNGVLILVVRDDRRMRIEVGYGLEGTLTDLHAKLIIENTMVPAFRAGDFSGGLERAVDDAIMVLEGNAAELMARGQRNLQRSDDLPIPVIIFMIVWCAMFLGGFTLAFLVPRFGRKLGPGRYRWLGMDITIGGGMSGGSASSGWSSGGSSSRGGGFSGGGGSSGGGGASGSW